MTTTTLLDAGTAVRTELVPSPIPQVDSITDSCMHSGAEQKIAIVRRLGSVAGLALARRMRALSVWC